MICNASWRLVRDPMGDLDELYCLQSDTYEHRNLANDARYEPIKRETDD